MKFAIINREIIPKNLKRAFKEFFGADFLSRREVNHNKLLLKNYDFVLLYGVILRKYRDLCEELGVNWVFLDKALDRERLPDNPDRMVKLSINSYFPTKHLDKFENNDSRINTVTDFLPIRETEIMGPEAPVVFAGSSPKYHAWHGMPHGIPLDPTKYARKYVKKIKAFNRPIIYKPKPSWAGKVPIRQTKFLKGGGLRKWIEKELIERPYCLIAHGSGILMEANFLGIPTIVLGDSPVKKLSRTRVEHMNHLCVPTLEEKYKVANSVSCFQWNSSEIESGEMWNYLKPVFEEELNGS